MTDELRATGSLDQVHEIPRCLTICLAFKCDIQIGRRSQSMQQCPEREPLATVLGQAEVDFHMLDAGVEGFRRDCGQIEVPK